MKTDFFEIGRYIVNGLIATIIHYAALSFNIHYAGIESAGISNIVASFFGITASFLGSRYFVFPDSTGNPFSLMIRFSGLYVAIAVLHGITLGIWTDLCDFDYRIGFLIATAMQVSLSYIGNKRLVFKS